MDQHGSLGGSFWREREITSINTGSNRVRPGVGGVSHGRRHGSVRQVGSGLAEGGDGEGAAAGSGDEPCVVGGPGIVILPLRGGHGALVHGALGEVGAERDEAGDVFQVNRFAGCHEHVGASSISVAWREAEHVFEELVELVAQVSLDAHVGPGDEAVVCGELAGSRRATTLGMSPEASRIMAAPTGRGSGLGLEPGWSSCRTARRRSLSGTTSGGLRPVGYAPLGNRHETLQRGVHRRQEPDRIFTGRIHDSFSVLRGTPSSLTQYRFNPSPRPDRWPRT